MTGQSQDILNEKINKLKEIIPEVFTENKIDFEKLKLALGENINLQNERYVLNWAGKSDSFKVLQMPTTATLAPSPDESIDFDKTGNVFIEGENLEVLKILQKSYHGKIKMIYIDPPYNTGNDSFIYPDKFSETKEEYLKRIQEKDSDGYYTKEGLFRKNSSENGQFHSNWLSMIYPRLYLARSLLRDDGVIFVSIDDNEVHNLRMAMNEIFGEENFVDCLKWKRKKQPSFLASHTAKIMEYILVYGKNKMSLEKLSIDGTSDFTKKVINVSNKESRRFFRKGLRIKKDGEGIIKSGRYKIKTMEIEYLQDINYNNGITLNDIEVISKFSVSQEKIDNYIKNNLLFITAQNGLRRDVSEEEIGKRKSITDLLLSEWGDNQDSENELKSIFNSSEYFDYNKPVKLVFNLIKSCFSEEMIILDFFAGSGTTAHAVLELNKEDGGNRKFICVQLPEKTDENSEAYKAGYKTIADISKERIRRVIKKIEKKQEEARGFNPLFPDSDSENQIDLGFKVLKLKQSNFKLWRGDVIDNNEELEKQLEMFIDPVKEGAKEDNICYELLIKSGYELTVPIDKTNDYYIINNGEMIISINKIDDVIVKDIISKNPGKCIILDSLFNSNDQLKTNTVLQMKNAGIDFRSV
ncbi:MAG: site-specific DNA-methyltransferase [Spirochaetes bacterium]|nr:site-specific DNA-methyltransferase [Spirochaetota bacterium]